MQRFVFFAFVLLLTQVCVGSDDDINAYCDICRLANSETKCPTDMQCTEGPMEAEPGIVGTCHRGVLTELDIESESITKIPESINKISLLWKLKIQGTSVEQLPVLDKLENLAYVFLDENKIKSLNGVFANCPKMTFLSAMSNELAELPPELANLSLTTLLVAHNEIDKIPPEYKEMTTLNKLDISDNNLDCDEIGVEFAGTIFAQECISAQQKADQEYPALPLDFSGDPAKEGLDGYEITAIILAVVFVIVLVLGIVLFVWYRGKNNV